LPLLIGAFRFGALQAVILNKAMSLVVVASALPFRAATVPFSALAAHWSVIANLLAGSLIGAWFGASWATRIASHTLYRVIAVLLVAIAFVMVAGHDTATPGAPLLAGAPRLTAGIVAGFAIGIVAALLGVAGGELLIPTLILLFGADIKLAGSLALAVSLPTMLVGFARYSRDRSFSVLGENRVFVLVMGRLDRRQLHRWPIARLRSFGLSAAAAGRDLGALSDQGVAAQVSCCRPRPCTKCR
jgi:uncharacterized protein